MHRLLGTLRLVLLLRLLRDITILLGHDWLSIDIAVVNIVRRVIAIV
jgi:hypothetical protein